MHGAYGVGVWYAITTQPDKGLLERKRGYGGSCGKGKRKDCGEDCSLQRREPPVKSFLNVPAEPKDPSWFKCLWMLPPVCYKGNNQWLLIWDLTWDAHRSVMVVTYMGTPVEEALVSIIMQSEGAVIHIKYDTTAGPPLLLDPSHPMDAT